MISVIISSTILFMELRNVDSLIMVGLANGVALILKEELLEEECPSNVYD
jgi:hypothetical protein